MTADYRGGVRHTDRPPDPGIHLKECQTKGWLTHKQVCDFSLRKKKETLARIAAQPKEAPTVTKETRSNFDMTFKSLGEIDDLNYCTIHFVTDPEDFSVAPADDNPLDYYILQQKIKQFVEEKRIMSLLESPSVGDVVIATVPVGMDDETPHQRAVIQGVYEAPVQKQQPIDPPLFPTPPPLLLDIWFADSGFALHDVSLSEVIPIREFWDHLKSQKFGQDAVDPLKLISMPARVLRCFLHARGQDGESQPIVTGEGSEDGEMEILEGEGEILEGEGDGEILEGDGEILEGDGWQFKIKQTVWDKIAVDFMKKLMFREMDLILKDVVEGVVPTFGVEMKSGEIGIGDSLVDTCFATFENEDSDEDSL